jgi:hypothetical protein
MASNDARGMGMDGRRISSNEEDYVQEGDSSEDFGEHYRGSAIIPAPEPSVEPPPVVNVSLGIVGEALYPPLQIVEIPHASSDEESTLINLDFFMIPEAFNETFNSRWSAEDLSHGRINPMHNYGGTQREITIVFTLAALTVAESRSNLSVCQDLARTVYGRYKSVPLTGNGGTANGGTATVFAGRREFIVDFGGLIRDERAFINSFVFSTDMDAGVFDYSAGDDTDVTHGTSGVVLPRAVKVEMGLTVVHDVLLGFGGVLRKGSPLRWAENRNRDWPHGTGKIDVQRYMSANEVQFYNPPVILTNDRHILDPEGEVFLDRHDLRSSTELQEARRNASIDILTADADVIEVWVSAELVPEVK